MPMEEALVARLTGVTAISNIVGTNISWFERPRAFPAVTLTEVFSGREWTQDGPDGLDAPRVQFDCWSTKPSQAEAIARLILAEMEQLTPVTVSGWVFYPAWLEQRIRDAEQIDGGAVIYRTALDLNFHHSSAT